MPDVEGADREDMASHIFRHRRLVSSLGVVLACAAAACSTAPAVTPAAPITFDEKVSWILRLENQRVLRDTQELSSVADEASASAPRPRVSLRSEPDLLVLLRDPEPQLRRRAALAIGRIGLAGGVEPLTLALHDPEAEVRQMAAFSLGLIGHDTATEALVAAMDDAEPIVQGRAAEALGRIGAVDSAGAIGRLLQRHITSAFGLDPEDVSYPLAPEVEAFRLALFALGELRAYEELAEVVLQDDHQPILWWWPVAYALQRTGDPRALDALVTLAGVQGSVGVAFAAQGLGALGTADRPAARDALAGLLDRERRDPHVIASAIRALGQVDDPRAAEALRRFALTRDLPRALRLEAIAALGELRAPNTSDLFVELATDPWPPMRAAALRALARSDQTTFLLALSGLHSDPEWRVRAALAEGLAFVNPEAASYQLTRLLDDEDERVIPFVLRSLATQEAPDLVAVLIRKLGDDDVVVRKTAAELLGSAAEGVGPGEVTVALAEAFASAAMDSEYLARAAIIAALAGVDREGSRDILEAALSDPDWAVRVRADQLLNEFASGDARTDRIRPAPGRRSVDFTAPSLVRPQVSPHAYIETDHGTIELELNVIDAPITSENFMVLARRGFYDGLAFHRVVPNYVVQGGDPRSDGEGGPGYTLRDELNQLPYLRGTVGMALDWEDTGGSQFFITHSPQPHLDGRYTTFARVVAGLDVVDQLEQGDLIRRVLVWDGVAPLAP